MRVRVASQCPCQYVKGVVAGVSGSTTTDVCRCVTGSVSVCVRVSQWTDVGRCVSVNGRVRTAGVGTVPQTVVFVTVSVWGGDVSGRVSGVTGGTRAASRTRPRRDQSPDPDGNGSSTEKSSSNPR